MDRRLSSSSTASFRRNIEARSVASVQEMINPHRHYHWAKRAAVAGAGRGYRHGLAGKSNDGSQTGRRLATQLSESCRGHFSSGAQSTQLTYSSKPFSFPDCSPTIRLTHTCVQTIAEVVVSQERNPQRWDGNLTAPLGWSNCLNRWKCFVGPQGPTALFYSSSFSVKIPSSSRTTRVVISLTHHI